MTSGKAKIIPALRYKDAKAAIDWLCTALGFEQHLLVEGENGSIDHAQLVLDNCMVMLGSMRTDAYGQYFSTPDHMGGINTQAPYIVLEQIEAHYEKAVAEKAEIILPLKEEQYGGKSYSCRDPEGHIWNFGSYDPWEQPKP